MVIWSLAVTLDDINSFFENKNKRVHTCNVQLNANYEHGELETWIGKEIYKVHKHGKQLDRLPVVYWYEILFGMLILLQSIVIYTTWWLLGTSSSLDKNKHNQGITCLLSVTFQRYWV